MRWLMFLLVAGCTDGVAPPNFTSDDASVGDMGEDDLSGSVDAAPIDLLPANPDLTPQGCRTACDCPDGQACANNVCTTSVQVFCCGTAACTGADTCQFPDGRFSQCAAPQDGGIKDAGTSATCTNTPCTPGLGSQLFCSLACGTLTAMCSGSTKHCTP